MGFPLVLKYVTLNDLEQRSKFLASITPVLIAHSVAMFASRKGFSIVADLMMWMPSLSRDRN